MAGGASEVGTWFGRSAIAGKSSGIDEAGSLGVAVAPAEKGACMAFTVDIFALFEPLVFFFFVRWSSGFANVGVSLEFMSPGILPEEICLFFDFFFLFFRSCSMPVCLA